jgi:hypothetical protein
VATKLTLKLASRGKVGALIQAAISFAHNRRHVPAVDLPGQVTFRVPGIGPKTVPVDVTNGWAFFDLPLAVRKVRAVRATFTGNGYLAPSTASLRHP